MMTFAKNYVKLSAEKDLVLTRSTLVSVPGWASPFTLFTRRGSLSQ